MKAKNSYRYPTPLRYPGGKQRLGPYFERLFTLNSLGQATYVEPFAGGAGAALYLLARERVSAIHLNDIDRSIYAFWYSITRRNGALIQKIRRARVSVAEWDRQKDVQRYKDDASLIDLGFSTLFLNRTNRSGILRAGMIGGREQKGKWTLGARYNKDLVIARVEAIGRMARRISLSNLDACRIDDLTFGHGASAFLYLDPPYFVKGRDLYTSRFGHHDHATLAEKIQKTQESPWIVTYDDVPEIRKLYQGYRQRRFGVQYTADKRRIGSEFMVFSKGLRASRLGCI